MDAPTRTRPQRGELLELAIGDLAFGGAGVARTDGYVVFVQGAVPGDTVRAEVTKSKRSFAEARATEVLAPGPDRIEPEADHPGAPWQVLRYERQLEVKHAQVDDALRRLGGLDGFELEPIVPAEQTWRYRNKLEYSFGTDDDGGLVCGFHAPGRWDRILGMDDCLLASERGNDVRNRIAAWCRDAGLNAYDRRAGDGFLRNLVIRESRTEGKTQARLVTGKGEFEVDALAEASGADAFMWTTTEQLGETTQGGETQIVTGSAYLEEELAGLRFRISPEAFFQTNTEMAERLYAIAGEYAALAGRERVFDLFCGIGTVGLSLSARAAQLYGLEIVPEAVADAIENAHLNEVEHAQFFAGDVRLALRELVEKAGKPDVLVVDPPRSGLSKKVVRRIIEAAPKRLVYISCNPTTLAPNAAQLAEAGYVLRRVRPVDMFPQTPHIECVALLERIGTGQSGD
jgi:23S rRNA (uracil1939-C5)-methyltransferase